MGSPVQGEVTPNLTLEPSAWNLIEARQSQGGLTYAVLAPCNSATVSGRVAVTAPIQWKPGALPQERITH